MQNAQPLVSIILPVRNAEMFLADCLINLLKQTYSQIEIIAVDDFSKDRSFALLKQFRKDDKRIKILKNVKHYGMAVCLNRALKQAQGSFIAFTNPSITATASRIAKQVRYLLANPKIAAVGTQCHILSDKKQNLAHSQFPTAHEEICSQLLLKTPIQFETIMVNKTLLPKDLLYFKPFSGVIPATKDVFLKIIQYGKLANLPYYLHSIRSSEPRKNSRDTSLQKAISALSLLVRSVTLYDYRPSLRALFGPTRITTS